MIDIRDPTGFAVLQKFISNIRLIKDIINKLSFFTIKLKNIINTIGKMINENLNIVFLESPIGILKISGDREGIVHLTFCDKMGEEDPTDVLTNCRQQLIEYFNKERQQFLIPVKLSGTDFQKEVWREVSNIPYGKTISYSEIAKILGNIKKSRAVGMANSRNPIPIIIPCHRVTGSHGELTGYSGGLERKKWLLEHEKESLQLSLFNGSFFKF